MLSLRQEAGRAGRWDGASPNTDKYLICSSLSHYIYLISRIYKPKVSPPDGSTPSTPVPNDRNLQGRDTTDEILVTSDSLVPLASYQQSLHDNVNAVTKFLLFPKECMHCSLARLFGNPFHEEHNATISLPPCVNACDYCLNSGKLSLPLLSVSGTRLALADLFHGRNKIPDNEYNETFLNAIRNYPHAQQRFYGSASRQKPKLKTIEQMLLMLFTANILTLRPDVVKGTSPTEPDRFRLLVNLGFDETTGAFHLNEDTHWELIPKKT